MGRYLILLLHFSNGNKHFAVENGLSEELERAICGKYWDGILEWKRLGTDR